MYIPGQQSLFLFYWIQNRFGRDTRIVLNLVFAPVPSALTLIVILLAPALLLPAYEVIYETERRNIVAALPTYAF